MSGELGMMSAGNYSFGKDAALVNSGTNDDRCFGRYTSNNRLEEDCEFHNKEDPKHRESSNCSQSKKGIDGTFRLRYNSNNQTKEDFDDRKNAELKHPVLPNSKGPSSSIRVKSSKGFHLLRPKCLVTWRELPPYLQFNPYIVTGYRPLLSLWECVLSLFYVHNETVNIVTHGVPMLYILCYWSILLPWGDINVPVLPWTHLVSTVSPWIGSTIYHMFMNHRAGERCYKTLLYIDIFGIWITQSFGALTTVYASVYCMPVEWVWRILVIYCMVSVWCLYKASNARNAWDRRFCFTLPLLMRAAAIYIRKSAWGGGDPLAFRHVILQDITAVIGGFIGALRIPEKWVPGRLDMLANSHHIMHVVVVYAVYHLHQGAVLDMLWLSHNATCGMTHDANSTATT